MVFEYLTLRAYQQSQVVLYFHKLFPVPITARLIVGIIRWDFVANCIGF